MAQTFKNARSILSTSLADIYTCPSATVAIILGAQVANKESTPTGVDVLWTDASAANAATYLSYETAIPVGAAYEPIGGKLTLEAGDKIRAKSEVVDGLEMTLSILELT